MHQLDNMFRSAASRRDCFIYSEASRRMLFDQFFLNAATGLTWKLSYEHSTGGDRMDEDDCGHAQDEEEEDQAMKLERELRRVLAGAEMPL